MRLSESYKLRCAGMDVATIQRDKGGLWFWYGSGNNSLWTQPPMSLEDAKAQALKAAEENSLRTSTETTAGAPPASASDPK